MSEPLLRVEQLSTSYFPDAGEVAAVKEVDLHVEPGETFGVVGASGSGKSTLIASIAGLVKRPGRIVDGRVLLAGEELTGMSRRELQHRRGRQFGLIAANPHTLLNPLIPVGRQIAHAARANAGLDRNAADRRAVEMLEAVGIPDPARRAEQYPHQLSGGMAQRIVISIGLVASPQLLLADEPTFGLDVTIQAQVLELMRQLVMRNDETSTLLVTRDLGIVAQYCDRFAVMHEGRIVESGDVGTIWKHPEHAATRRLIDAAQLRVDEHAPSAPDRSVA